MRQAGIRGPALRRPLLVVALAAVAAAAAAFAVGGSRGAEAARALPGCAHAGPARALPSGLAAFPLPAGSVVDARVSKYGYSIFTGYVPGAINPVRDFLVSRLPHAGYRLGAGDSEASEAEAAYAGHGLRGRYKVREIAGCPGALSLQLAVRPLRAQPASG
jgi:hypothetical protein